MNHLGDIYEAKLTVRLLCKLLSIPSSLLVCRYK